MPRDLFGAVTRPSISIGNRKWYTLPLSLVSHTAIVAILIALPLLAPAVMPSVFADDDPTWITTTLPPPPPPPAPVRLDTRKPAVNPNLAPIQVPSTIAPENLDLPEFVDPPPVGVIGGTENLNLFLPAPPPAAPPPPPEPVRVGFGVRPPQKTRHVDPVYSPLAQSVRVQGVVILEATIGADGRVINARILRSVPLLDQSAIDAVSQWQFTPTLLNGAPVPVIMTVTINFTLK